MPKFTVQIERALIEARLVEVEASDERKARRMALKMARHVDNGGTVAVGSVGEFTDGTPSDRVRVSAIWKGWSCNPNVFLCEL